MTNSALAIRPWMRFAFLLSLLLVGIPLYAQHSSNVQGLISDPLGAAVNGATNLGPVDFFMGDPGFGKSFTSLPARQMQLGVRVSF